MATLYNLAPQLNAKNGWGLFFSDVVVSATLAADTDTTFTVPGTSNTFVAIFSYQKDEDFWINVNAAADHPAGAALAAGSHLNPAAFTVKTGDVIHVLCVAGANISISLYALYNA